MWTYNQSTGWLDKDGILVSKTCYSGIGFGLNNSAAEADHDLGPIPRGLWIISGPPFESLEHGRYCLRLDPAEGTITFGRSGFLVHGDEVEHPGQYLASHGCIIADRATRERLYQSGDTKLQVVTTPPEPTIQGENTES